jgi:hypothetical protein
VLRVYNMISKFVSTCVKNPNSVHRFWDVTGYNERCICIRPL